MPDKRVLVYGATGYTGRLIAHAAALRWPRDGGVEAVLAARDEDALRRIGDDCGLRCMRFALDDRRAVVDALRGCSVVINAAGPFALTAERLATAALEVGCHYVDVNGEFDVYQQLDDLGFIAAQRNVVLVCGAGATATTSDVMLAMALKQLRTRAAADSSSALLELGALRVAVTRSDFASRGSVRTAMRRIREQVPVVRRNHAVSEKDRRAMRVQHVPVGQLERAFDFAKRKPHVEERRKCRKNLPGFPIGGAVSLIDTLVALRTAQRRNTVFETIESYIEMPSVPRSAFDFGSLAAPWLNLPPWRGWTERVVDLLPEGPSAEERKNNDHVVLLQIEDAQWHTVIDWHLQTPDAYEFSASSAVAVADRLLNDATRGELKGWVTPAQALGDPNIPSRGGPAAKAPFDDCLLTKRE